MTEWIITPERYSGECEHFIDGDCGARENTKCNFENCPLKIDDRPITAEWLESVGAINNRQGIVLSCDPLTCLVVKSEYDGLSIYINVAGKYGHKLDIQNRHQFRKLYRLLSGRELGK